jgi:hypothetical protein
MREVLIATLIGAALFLAGAGHADLGLILWFIGLIVVASK